MQNTQNPHGQEKNSNAKNKIEKEPQIEIET